MFSGGSGEIENSKIWKVNGRRGDGNRREEGKEINEGEDEGDNEWSGLRMDDWFKNVDRRYGDWEFKIR